MYPVGSTIGTLNCQDLTLTTTENCPDHGPLIAFLVSHIFSPTVYGSGVLGHDHILGVASTGGDFNIDWVPVLVLFTPKAVTDGAINEPIRTLNTLNMLVRSLDVIEISLPPATFHCAVVPAALYNSGTPVA